MLSNDELKKQRMDICLKCEHYSKSLTGMCKVCGCILHLKTALKKSKCPKKKW
jgi:hypothetical protein